MSKFTVCGWPVRGGTRRITKILLVMKLTVFLLTAGFLHVAANGIAQQVTLSGKQLKLENVFQSIKQQTGYFFLYPKDILADAKPVDVNVQNMPVSDFLELILKDQALAFNIKSKTVNIFRAGANHSIHTVLSNDPITTPITGVIRDAEGNPIAGVNIVVKGTKRGVVSDAYGNFRIDAKEGEVLIISSINYGTKEIRITSLNAQLIVALEKNVSQLDEVQYIAYGTTSKRFSTGNIAEVKAVDIEKQPINNPLLALQGRVPGMTILQANGVPGGGVTVRIQGRNNLDYNMVGSDPFIVIDGTPYPSQNLSTFKGGSVLSPILGSSSNDATYSTPYYGNPLAFLNPADIESITVLKDADATAIYGSRAANGAILITTKKGNRDVMKTDINLQQGWGQVPKKMKLLNSQQYMEMRWEAKRNDGRAANSFDYDLRGVWDTTKYTDWQDVLIGGTAQYTRLTAGISGGNSNLQYLISSTYGRETTVFPGDFANTFGSLHFNISASSSNQRFKIQLGGSYMANNNKLPSEDYTIYALNLPPVAPALYNSDGTLNWAPDPLTGNSTWFNPISWQYKLFETKTNNLVSNANVSYLLARGLELKSTFGFTSITSDQFAANLDETEKPEFRENRFRTAIFSFNTSRSWIAEPQLTFERNWGIHRLSVLAGTTFQYQNNYGRAFVPYGQNNDLMLRDMLAGTGLSTYGTDINEYKYNAFFGRVNYIFREKYLLNITGRRDGSSRFGPQSQFNNFGAIGAGWIISEEPFLQRTLPFISFAKLRGSYGTTGNDQIGNYRFMNLYSTAYAGIQYQGIGGTESLGLPNPYLEWEETKKLQFGIDLGFWKDRLLLTVNNYRNRSSNSLTNMSMPWIAGFNTFITNLPALIENTGWEFTLGSNNLPAGSLRWNTNINLTIPRNKLVEFPGLEFSTLNQILTIGKPTSGSRTYKNYGVNPATGGYLIANEHGDLVSTPAFEDQNVFLSSLPRWYGGIQNRITYKGISVDFLLQATHQYRKDVLQLATIPGYFASDDGSFMFGNQPVSVMDRWQKPGDIKPYQRFSTRGVPGSEGDLAYKDLSFARMKNLSISYQFPVSWIQNLNIQQLRVYVNAQNLFTITRYKGLDPETFDISSLPPLRMIVIGVQAAF